MLAQDNGDGEGRYNATASWGTTGAADSFTTFMDSKTYTSKISAEEIEVKRVHEKNRGRRDLEKNVIFSDVAKSRMKAKYASFHELSVVVDSVPPVLRRNHMCVKSVVNRYRIHF